MRVVTLVMMPATARPSRARPARMPDKGSNRNPELPARPYKGRETISSGLRPQRSTSRPAMGAPMTTNRAGTVKTSLTSKSAWATSEKRTCMAGSDGAMVAPARTVKALATSKVPLTRGKSGSNRFMSSSVFRLNSSPDQPALAQDAQVHPLPHGIPGQDLMEAVHTGDRPVVQGEDHVPFSQTRPVGRTSRHHLRHHDSPVLLEAQLARQQRVQGNRLSPQSQ